ncbi:hypothetical protein [Sphingomonas sp. RT2P30]|uniref:hypothetical protein n=1 Tax=Parasphingomonas halimpatiens TaxID=3096162 RepID=UPI002FC7965E
MARGGFFLVLVTLLGVSSANAMQVPHASVPTASCRAEVALAWPSLVEAPHEQPAPARLSTFDASEGVAESQPAARGHLRGALASTDHLLGLCAENPAIMANLRSLSAELRIAAGDFTGAAAQLAPASTEPSAPLIRRNMLLLLGAGLKSGDAAYFATVRREVATRHDKLMRLAMGVDASQRIDTPIAVVDGYRSKSRSMRAVFIGWPNAGGAPLALFVREPDSDGDGQADLVGCSASTSLDYPASVSGGATSDQDLIGFARKIFSDAVRLDEFRSPNGADCLEVDRVLPAFANSLRFIGNEYSDRDVLTEKQLELMLGGSEEQSQDAVHYTEIHPESVNPMMLPLIISKLMRRGDMMHAAFWYYFWQIRSAPWAKFGPPDGYPALRGAFSAALGPVINGWAGSDPDAFRDLMTRATSFERRAPLYGGKPDGVTDTAWQAAIARSRLDHNIEQLDSIFPRDAAGRQKYLDRRKANGLYVGPLRDPGEPLPETWR